MIQLTRARIDQTLTEAIQGFIRSLEAKNRSGATITAYRSDLTQFASWLAENNVTADQPERIERVDVEEFLAHLGSQKVMGITRARKLAAIRELFRYLEETGAVTYSPTKGIETPRKEKNARTYLQSGEYTTMLSLAGVNPRDYAILQVFLQTGIRVSELCALRLEDVDLPARMLRVTSGKGNVAREIELERKGVQSIKSWLDIRPQAASDYLFLNQYGDPISERGVQKLVTKYTRAAGITKRAGCHSLRHTFATHKAKRGVSAFQLKEWLGHARLDTTQIYVHLARQDGKKAMEATSL